MSSGNFGIYLSVTVHVTLLIKLQTWIWEGIRSVVQTPESSIYTFEEIASEIDIATYQHNNTTCKNELLIIDIIM